MFKLDSHSFIILIVFQLISSVLIGQVELCESCYVWEFSTDNGERNQTTRLLSNDIEDILSQYPDCKVLQRSRYAKLQEQINNENKILSLSTAPTQIKTELKTINAKRVIFGSVNRDFQGNVSLRISFENLETSQVRSNTVFLINEDYYNFDKRKQKLTEFIGAFIDPEGKLKSNTPQNGKDSSTNNSGVAPQTLEDGLWKLTLEDCFRSGNTLTFSLKATSKNQDRVLTIIGSSSEITKIIDDQGREFMPSEFQIANSIDPGYWISHELISDLPTQVFIKFSDIPVDANKIMLLNLHVSGASSVFKFRNINIRK